MPIDTADSRKRRRRGREATTEAILIAAEKLFSARGFSGVAIRDIGEHAGVSHALVQRYVGHKADVYRTVLKRNEDAILNAAPDDPDLLASGNRMFRAALALHRPYVRLIVQSAIQGLSYEETPGRFAATERLVELAEQAAASTSPADSDLDPRLVVAGAVALLLGWVAAESWLCSAVGIEDMDEAEIEEGLGRLFVGVLSEVPGVEGNRGASG